jgi:hypothetical protein
MQEHYEKFGERVKAIDKKNAIYMCVASILSPNCEIPAPARVELISPFALLS